MALPRILIGADPEVFIKPDLTSKTYISGHGVIPGTKHEPYKVTKGAVQVDGLALEFNIDPASNAEEFLYNIETVYGQMKGMVKEGILVADPVATFTPEYFRQIPEEAKALGCNPDFNAWTGKVNEIPDSVGAFRTASGHIHVGWTKDADIFDEDHIEDCKSVVKELDFYLGMYSLSWDLDKRRRTLYGQAGAFRPKPYGVEYRVLSNVWLRSPDLIQWVFNQTKLCITRMFSGVILETEFKDYPVQVINQGKANWIRDVEGQKIVKRIGVPLPKYIEAYKGES